jgi:hypothetical protein
MTRTDRIFDDMSCFMKSDKYFKDGTDQSVVHDILRELSKAVLKADSSVIHLESLSSQMDIKLWEEEFMLNAVSITDDQDTYYQSYDIIQGAWNKPSSLLRMLEINALRDETTPQVDPMCVYFECGKVVADHSPNVQTVECFLLYYGKDASFRKKLKVRMVPLLHLFDRDYRSDQAQLRELEDRTRENIAKICTVIEVIHLMSVYILMSVHEMSKIYRRPPHYRGGRPPNNLFSKDHKFRLLNS